MFTIVETVRNKIPGLNRATCAWNRLLSLLVLWVFDSLGKMISSVMILGLTLQDFRFFCLMDISRKKQQTPNSFPKSDHFKYIYLTLRVRIGNSPVNWIGKFLILALNLVGGPLDFRFRFRVRFREIFGSFDHQNLGLNRSNMLKNIPEMKAKDFLTGVFTSGKY